MSMVANVIKQTARITNKDKRREHYKVWVEKFGPNIFLMD